MRSFGVSAYTFLQTLSYSNPPDVLSEPDDSYPIHESKKTKKPKDIDTSKGIGAFLSKPPALAADSEDVAMNEGETGTTNQEPSV